MTFANNETELTSISEASNATSSSNNIASSATGANSHPLPDRPNFSLSRLSAARPPGVQQKQQPAADSGPVTEPPFPTEQHSVYVFASPQTGIPYTKQDLEELARGRIDERGDRVYFKPGFVDDDPWSRLHNGVQSRTKGGGGRGKRSRENGESAEHEHWATAKVEALTI